MSLRKKKAYKKQKKIKVLERGEFRDMQQTVFKQHKKVKTATGGVKNSSNSLLDCSIYKKISLL